MNRWNIATHWEMRDLVVVGIFAAVTKVAGLLVVLVGGGMNPITFILKNLLLTTLVIVLLYKVCKFGTLALFVLVNTIVSALFLGGGIFLLPPMLAACLLAEGAIVALGGYRKGIGLLVGVAIFDFMYRAISLGFSLLYSREKPELLLVSFIIVVIGYSGSLIGLWTGKKMVRELRHACIIRH